MWHDFQYRGRPSLKPSRHASVRTQQRSIPKIVQDGLLDFGDFRNAGSGAASYFFSKRSWRKFADYLGVQAKYFEQYRDAYIVVATDGTIITVCWRH